MLWKNKRWACILRGWRLDVYLKLLLELRWRNRRRGYSCLVAKLVRINVSGITRKHGGGYFIRERYWGMADHSYSTHPVREMSRRCWQGECTCSMLVGRSNHLQPVAVVAAAQQGNLGLQLVLLRLEPKPSC